MECWYKCLAWDRIGEIWRKAMMQFDNIEGLGDYLSSLPENTPDTPYTVKLDIGNPVSIDRIAKILRAARRYASLDFSGCAWMTGIPAYAFDETPKNSNSFKTTDIKNTFLAGIALPDSVTSINAGSFAGCAAPRQTHE